MKIHQKEKYLKINILGLDQQIGNFGQTLNWNEILSSGNKNLHV